MTQTPSAQRSSSSPASVSDPLSSGCTCPRAMASERRDVFINTAPKQRQDAKTSELLILA